MADHSAHPPSEPAERAAYLSPGALYRVLREDFERLRPKSCVSCRVPPPIPRQPAAPDEPNWHIPPLHPCEVGCDITIMAIVAEAFARYRMSGSFGVGD